MSLRFLDVQLGRFAILGKRGFRAELLFHIRNTIPTGILNAMVQAWTSESAVEMGRQRLEAAAGPFLRTAIR